MPKKPMEETPDFLHFKHKFGFLENFIELYKAFFWACEQRDIKIDHQKCDTFFMKYIENMGFEPEFAKAIIDPRSFTIQIDHADFGPPTVITKVNAGRLHQHQKEFLPLINIKGLTECSLTIDGNVYSLKLEK